MKHVQTVLSSGMLMTALGLLLSHPNLAHAGGQTEKCIASWYGPGLQGGPMANGERFDMNDPNTIAHSSLPMGTIVQVTNLNNDLVASVEVTDRGPNGVRGRCVDGSRAVAQKLQYYVNDFAGTAPVSVRILWIPFL